MHLTGSMREGYLQKRGHFTSNWAAPPSKPMLLPAASTAFVPSQKVGLKSSSPGTFTVYSEVGTEPVIPSGSQAPPVSGKAA